MITRRFWNLPSSAAIGLAVLFSAQSASSYSVLTHEAIIDSTWDSAIKPLLLKRFPASTRDDLTQSHAYAYGGSIIQAGFFRIVPKVGPFKALAFKRLTPETEQLYMAGFNASIDRYRELLGGVSDGRLAQVGWSLHGYAARPQKRYSGFLPGPQPADRH
jgi:hypothetical protein